MSQLISLSFHLSPSAKPIDWLTRVLCVSIYLPLYRDIVVAIERGASALDTVNGRRSVWCAIAV